MKSPAEERPQYTPPTRQGHPAAATGHAPRPGQYATGQGPGHRTGHAAPAHHQGEQ